MYETNIVQRARNQLFSIEFLYISFLFAGLYKEARIFGIIPLNITAVLGLLVVIVTVNYFRINKIELTRKRATILSLFTLLLFYAAFSGLWSPSTDFFQSKLIRLIVINGISLLVPLLIIGTSKTRMHRLGVLTLGFSLVISALSIWNYIFDTWGVAPLNASYLVTGRALGVTVLILVYIIFFRHDSLKKQHMAVMVLLAIISFSSLIIIGARGPLVATILSLVLLFALGSIHKFSSSTKFSLKYLILLSALFFLGIINIGSNFRGILRLRQLMDGPGSSLGIRLEYYMWTLQNIQFPSVIFGRGFGSWPIHRLGLDIVAYPHNLFLEIIFELGIIGLLIFTLLIVFSLRNSIGNEIHGQTTIGLLLVTLFLYMIININITGHLGSNRYFYAAIGLLCYYFDPSSVESC